MPAERLIAEYLDLLLGGAKFEDERPQLLLARMTPGEVAIVQRELTGELRRSVERLKPEADWLQMCLDAAFSGVKPTDPRLAVLLDALTPDELQRGKEAIGLEIMRREPLPPRAN